MDQVTSAGAPRAPTVFVKNTMEIAVPPDNPAAIAAVADLAKRGVKVALCQAQVPCGATAAAGLQPTPRSTVTPVTQEADVKSVLAKVELGEVDAGVVYVTDVRAAGDKVKGIEIAERRQRLHVVPDRRPDQGARTPPAPRPSSPTCCRRPGRAC